MTTRTTLPHPARNPSKSPPPLLICIPHYSAHPHFLHLHSHPTLDDQFFSIDAFNRFTEETEATSTSSGSLGSKKKKGKAGKGKGKRKGLLGEEDEEGDDDDEDEDEEDDLGLDSEVGDLFGGDILAAAGDAGDSE